MAMSCTRLTWPQFCPDVSTDFVSDPKSTLTIQNIQYISSLFARRVQRDRIFGSRILEGEGLDLKRGASEALAANLLPCQGDDNTELFGQHTLQT